MDPQNQKNNDKSAPAEIHTSVEAARKAEEQARKERITDQSAEQHAHQEAKLVKQDLENKSSEQQ
ncbi:hypothetical protein G9A89_020772 [Geosiphon pyriformis]|nr:hypothetical protein G9A89_020772 [Geosiphon pyriformis]